MAMKPAAMFAEVTALGRDLADGEAALARLQADRAQWVEADEQRVRAARLGVGVGIRHAVDLRS